ncbi:unnamed protein product [Rodentolepis nana]|uniref:Vacuolar ATPase assembly protein VMA22 n=1 Tax=Rodentolepis nana TaxID=102285 RepID=A0A0R3TU68_RODNA|nr:unnamed protein product [Rodentolepis nana]
MSVNPRSSRFIGLLVAYILITLLVVYMVVCAVCFQPQKCLSLVGRGTNGEEGDSNHLPPPQTSITTPPESSRSTRTRRFQWNWFRSRNSINQNTDVPLVLPRSNPHFSRSVNGERFLHYPLNFYPESADTSMEDGSNWAPHQTSHHQHHHELHHHRRSVVVNSHWDPRLTESRLRRSKMTCVSPTDAEIDHVLLEHMANLSAYIDIYHHLENSLKRGRILLAKTRCSSIGVSANISHISYNLAEMSTQGATARVHIDDSANFELVDDLASFESRASSSEASKSSDHKVSDPIHWFCGVLVPSELKQSQLDFRRSLRFVIELANRRVNLLNSTHKLSNLLKIRRETENETPLILLNDALSPSSSKIQN